MIHQMCQVLHSKLLFFIMNWAELCMKDSGDFLTQNAEVLAECILEQVNIVPVSYTHLDVYKRQQPGCIAL